MKVNIYETVEVSAEQRVQIARHIDGIDAKKRDATRDEIKDFIWGAGKDWETVLEAAYRSVTGFKAGVDATSEDHTGSLTLTGPSGGLGGADDDEPDEDDLL